MRQLYLFGFYLWLLTQWAFAQHYYVQPFYNANELRVYDLSTGTLAAGVNTKTLPAGTGPNSIAIFRDRLFVSKDRNGPSEVLVYDLRNFTTAAPIATLSLPRGAIGLAVDPSTANLYIPTYGGGGSSGIYVSAPPYTSTTLFANFPGDFAANIAFDFDGNMWVTGFSFGGQANQQKVICYRNRVATQTLTLTNGTTHQAIDRDNPAATHPVAALSSPEGIAFTPNGDLWIANNRDFSTGLSDAGTLIRIPASKVRQYLGSGQATQPINAGDCEAFYIQKAKFGGLTFQGNTLLVNDQGQIDPGNVGGWVWKWDVTTPFNATNCITTNIPTTYPGNGAGAVISPLFIEDQPADLGWEPNLTLPAPWQSLDIWTRQTDDGQVTNEKVLGGSSCTVYVRVRNNSPFPSKGTETLRLYWAKASTGLGWPAPWNGQMIGSVKMGDTIGRSVITTPVQPGQTTLVKFTWTTPNPTDYSTLFPTGNEKEHFCLLVRMEHTDQGMRFAELTSQVGNLPDALIRNVRNNRQIGWRNIHITGTVASMEGAGVLMGNYSGVARLHHLRFQLLGPNGEPQPWGNAQLRLRFNNEGIDKIATTEYDRHNMLPQEDGTFWLVDPAKGLENLRLEDGEVFPVTVEWNPGEEMKDYVLVANQWAMEDGEEVLIGGQTFIKGEVPAFTPEPVVINDPGEEEPQEPTKCSPFWKCLPWWVWVVAGIVLLLLLVLIFRRKK